jgi:hypothetical protein
MHSFVAWLSSASTVLALQVGDPHEPWNTFAAWLQATPLSVAFQAQAPWLWPLCETLHFVGLALLLGVAGFIDLRLLGFMKTVPLSAVKKFIPWAVAGFAINLITGLAFFISLPFQYTISPVWWFKLLFILIAGLNAIFFQTNLGTRVLTLGPSENTPMSFKLVGAVSLVAWLGVLYCGRMLPYLGNGY